MRDFKFRMIWKRNCCRHYTVRSFTTLPISLYPPAISPLSICLHVLSAGWLGKGHVSFSKAAVRNNCSRLLVQKALTKLQVLHPLIVIKISSSCTCLRPWTKPIAWFSRFRLPFHEYAAKGCARNFKLSVPLVSHVCLPFICSVFPARHPAANQ